MTVTVNKTAPKSTASWAKRGSAAAAEMEKHEKELLTQKELNKKMWRFWVADGAEARITFVDGDLAPDGSIDFFTYYEHNLLLNGKWGNTFVCTKDVEPCPLCAENDKASFVGVFTVIDHREFKGKDGKVYRDTPKLFVCKRETIKQLQMLGGKRGGLAGCTFDVARTGDKSPAVGSLFDFIEKNSVDELKAKYVRKNPETGAVESYFVPADYESECQFRTAAELREAIPALAHTTPMGHVSQADKDLANEL